MYLYAYLCVELMCVYQYDIILEKCFLLYDLDKYMNSVEP